MILDDPEPSTDDATSTTTHVQDPPGSIDQGRPDAEQFERIRNTPGLRSRQHRPDQIGKLSWSGDPESAKSAPLDAWT